MEIFIVDDDQDFSESLALVIEGRGYTVDLASNGEDAIRKFKEKDYDLAFMDVKLPGKNGVESFLEIRKFKPHAKVVLMTGYSVEQLLSQAQENGAWEILHKPLNIPKVLKIIENLVKNRILVVDDDPDFIESIKMMFEQSEIKIYTAQSVHEALSCVDKNDIDVLILDLRMPMSDGLEIYLKLVEAGHQIPTIIVSAYVDIETQKMETFRSLSVDNIIRKPIDPHEFTSAIKRLVQQSKK